MRNSDQQGMGQNLPKENIRTHRFARINNLILGITRFLWTTSKAWSFMDHVRSPHRSRNRREALERHEKWDSLDGLYGFYNPKMAGLYDLYGFIWIYMIYIPESPKKCWFNPKMNHILANHGRLLLNQRWTGFHPQIGFCLSECLSNKLMVSPAQIDWLTKYWMETWTKHSLEIALRSKTPYHWPRPMFFHTSKGGNLGKPSPHHWLSSAYWQFSEMKTATDPTFRPLDLQS